MTRSPTSTSYCPRRLPPELDGALARVGVSADAATAQLSAAAVEVDAAYARMTEGARAAVSE